MSDRFARRRRAGFWGRIRRYLYATLGLAVAGALVWLFGWSNVLGVHSVTVSGETTLKAQTIKSSASVTLGQPLARVDTGAVEDRVGELARVESVDVGRRWPRTLKIEIVERTAIGWVEAAGEQKGLDHFGVLFRSYDEVPDELIEVRINSDRIDERERLLEETARVLATIRKHDRVLYDEVRRLDADTIDSVQIRLSGGRTVNWGSAEKPEAKVEVLRALLDIEASTYDVSAPEQPTTRE